MSKVFRLSEGTVIGLHCCILLAGDSDRPLSAREIAEQLNVSYNHTVMVCQRLRHAGIIASERGPQGGFRLTCNPKTTTLLAIYEALEGKLVDCRCLFSLEKCSADCPVFGDLIGEINQSVRNFFSSNTLKKLAEKYFQE